MTTESPKCEEASALRMDPGNKQNRPTESEIEKENHLPTHKRPENLNFTSLATLAFTNDPSGQMGVQEIYKFISKHFPFYDIKGQNDSGWKSSVRHTLTSSRFFEKKAKTLLANQKRQLSFGVCPLKMVRKSFRRCISNAKSMKNKLRCRWIVQKVSKNFSME